MKFDRIDWRSIIYCNALIIMAISILCGPIARAETVFTMPSMRPLEYLPIEIIVRQNNASLNKFKIRDYAIQLSLLQKPTTNATASQPIATVMLPETIDNNTAWLCFGNDCTDWKRWVVYIERQAVLQALDAQQLTPGERAQLAIKLDVEVKLIPHVVTTDAVELKSTNAPACMLQDESNQEHCQEVAGNYTAARFALVSLAKTESSARNDLFEAKIISYPWVEDMLRLTITEPNYEQTGDVGFGVRRFQEAGTRTRTVKKPADFIVTEF